MCCSTTRLCCGVTLVGMFALLELIEVQVGSYLGDEALIRVFHHDAAGIVNAGRLFRQGQGCLQLRRVDCQPEFNGATSLVDHRRDQWRRPRKRHTEVQIIAILKEHEAGVKTADLCRKHGISEASFYNWKAKYGGLEVSEAKRLKGLESENVRLKKLLADAMLDNAALKDLLAKKW